LSLSSVLRHPVKRNLFILTVLLLTVAAGVGSSWLPATWILAGLVGLGIVAAIFVRPMFGLYLLAFAIPLTYFQPVSRVNFVKVIGWVVGMAWLLYKAQTKRRVPMPDGLRWVAAFAFIATISILWTGDRTAALLQLATFVQVVALYLMVVDLVDSIEKVWRVLVVTSLGAAVASMGAVWLTLSRGSARLLFMADVSPNPFAGFLAFPLSLGLCLFISGVSPAGQIGAIALILVSLIPVMLAGAKLGSLAMIVAVLVVTLLAPMVTTKRRHTLRFLLIVALFTIVAIHIVRESPWWDRLAFAYRGVGVLGGREFLWPAMLYRWMQRPLFGWGWGASSDGKGLALTIRAYGLADSGSLLLGEKVAPHNSLLWAAVELGTVGAAILVAVYWVHLRHLLEVIKRSKGQDMLSVRTCLALVGIAVIVFLLSMGENVALRRLFWFPVALIEATWMIGTNATGPRRSAD